MKMVYTICYAFIFLAEILISLFYFENKFERKASNKLLLFSVVIVYALLYLSRLLNITLVNLIAFFACNLLLLHLCYKAKIKSAIFHCSILLVFNVTTESVVMLFSAAILGTELLACLDNSVNLIFQSTISKLLYFSSMYILSKVSSNERRKESPAASIILFLLPISSTLIIYAILYSLAEYELGQVFLTLLLIGIVVLLFSNIAVFWVYEFTLKTQSRNMELEYEKQKLESAAEYYDLLNEQNENSRIVMHDIKRHLNSIKSISGDDAVTEYIDDFIEDFSVNKSVDYCNNPMVNSIVNRYKSVCDRLGVKMNIDIRRADFGFMNQPDITALLDNLLENAVEAAENTENGFIDFSVFVRKNKYLSIQLTNSVKNIVAVKNNRIASSKKTDAIHGTGLKSIQKVVKKYDGEINMRFNEDDMTFSSNVVFEIPQLNYEY